MQNFSKLLPANLKSILASLPKIALALSGGVDSRFLGHAALLCGCEVMAINAAGPHIAPKDSEWAREWSRKLSLPLIPIEINPLDLEEVETNSNLRCYACKKALLAKMSAVLAACGPEWKICDGANFDDLSGYRPGLRAAREAGVRSPLAEAKIGKAEIRRLARETGLDFPGQPSRPCLLTRLNYGLKPDAEILARICACEDEIASAYGKTLEFRLRLLPEPVLQLTAEPPAGLETILSRHGFKDARMQIAEKISGFFDELPASRI